MLTIPKNLNKRLCASIDAEAETMLPFRKKTVAKNHGDTKKTHTTSRAIDQTSIHRQNQTARYHSSTQHTQGKASPNSSKRGSEATAVPRI
jgi:hypothetical protein